MGERSLEDCTRGPVVRAGYPGDFTPHAGVPPGRPSAESFDTAFTSSPRSSVARPGAMTFRTGQSHSSPNTIHGHYTPASDGIASAARSLSAVVLYTLIVSWTHSSRAHERRIEPTDDDC